MQAGPQPVAPGRALVRAARVVQEGRCGQAGGPGRRSVGGRDGGAASAAAVRAALGVGATSCTGGRADRQAPCGWGRQGEGGGSRRAVPRRGGSRSGAPVRGRARPAAVSGTRRVHGHAGRLARATARARAERRRDREGGRSDRASARSTRPRAGEREPTAPCGRIGRRAGGGAGMKLSHVDEAGRARMVDVGDKPVTVRTAVAEGAIRMSREAFRLVADQQVAKGDALAVSEVAGTLAAKRTAELIPLCHPLGLDHVEVDATLDEGLPGVRVRAAAKAVGRTGVEMEALTAVSVALLTVYDMVKAADRGMEIEKVRLLEKTGGTHGDWRRDAAD